MQGGSWPAPLLAPWQPGGRARRTALRYFSQFPKKPRPKKPCRVSSAFLPPGGSPSGRGSPSRSPHAGLLHTSGPSWHRGPVQTRPRLSSFSPHPQSLLTRTKQGKNKVIAVSSSPRSPVPPASFGLQPHHQRGGTLQLSTQPKLRSHPPKNISYRQQEEVARPPALSLQSTVSRGEVWEEKAAPGEGRRLEALQHRRRAVPTGRRRVWGRLSGGRWRRRPGRKSSW